MKTQQGEGAIGIPAPAGAEDRGGQRRLLQDRLHAFGIQEMKDIVQRKTVLFRESDVQAIVGRRRLQLKVE